MAECTSKGPPKSINFDCVVIDVACHPTRDMIATGDIDGQVSVYSYSDQQASHELMTFGHHKKSCRAVRFDEPGDRLVSVSKDKSLQVVDLNTGAVTLAIKKAHANPIYSLLMVDQNIVATGDDDGFLKVWDLRHRAAVMEVHENEEYISDMIVESSKRTLVATCGEGTLTAFDIRRHKMRVQSELFDSGLLSIAVVKNGTKVVCGSEDGVLNIFNWDEWGNISDRFPGHPISVESIVPLTDSLICTGAFDGVIRAVSILPNRLLGVVGEHAGMPVESLARSRCGRWLVSSGHDQRVAFWDLTDVLDEKVDATRRAKKSHADKPLGLAATAARSDFFADMAAGGEGSEGLGATVDGDKKGKVKKKKKNKKKTESSDSDETSEEEESVVQKEKEKKNCELEKGVKESDSESGGSESESESLDREDDAQAGDSDTESANNASRMNALEEGRADESEEEEVDGQSDKGSGDSRSDSEDSEGESDESEEL